MPRKSKPPMSAKEILEKIRSAGIAPTDVIYKDTPQDAIPLEPLSQRLKHVLNLTMNRPHSKETMLFFVMYDIESNKVRKLVAKYLIRQGCFRIQHSIYLADMPNDKCEEIKQDLAEVQAAYDNQDSILVVPIPTDYLRAMRVIGKALDFEVIMHSQNTLFF